MFKTNQIVYLVNSRYSDPSMCRVFASNEYESVLRVITYESGEEEPIEMLNGLLVRSNSQIFESEMEASKQIIWRQEQAKNYSEIKEQEQKISELEQQIKTLEERGKELSKNNQNMVGWAIPKFKPNDKLYFFNPKYVEEVAYRNNYDLSPSFGNTSALSAVYRYIEHDNEELQTVILAKDSIKYRFRMQKMNNYDDERYLEIDEKYCFTDHKERGEALLKFVKECESQKEAKREEEITNVSKEIDKLQLKLKELSNQSK